MQISEKDKMLSGKPYYAFGEELQNERQRARLLSFMFNSMHPEKKEEKNQIIVELFNAIGENFFIEPPFRCDYGHNISVGKNFYANYNCMILDCAKVLIGDNVLIAPNVTITTAGHPVHYLRRLEGYEYAFPITIGDNVWIGSGVTINPGVKIGDNSVIGSGSIVTDDIPQNCISFGNPCRVYREITDEDKQYYFKKYMF